MGYLYYTNHMKNIHLLHHQKNMRKMSMRLMTRYLVTDRTTDVVIEENMFYKCRKNYYYYGNSEYRKIIETIIILEIIVIGIGRTAITIYS